MLVEQRRRRPNVVLQVLEVQGVPKRLDFLNPVLKPTIFNLPRQVGCHWKARSGEFVNMFLKVAYEQLLLNKFLQFSQGQNFD